ncbi:MmcQ/YjbR family DNA-binding protein [Candidatus Saccharibacteria bacterium]|nr:MmcQ/YjbR family DNA-binding protein [Candidatus Saccharibacteria bacterium]
MINVAEYCLEKLGAEETYPFDATTTVMKVHGKMFALMAAVENPPSINLKCDPTRSILLRQEYPEIAAGYHMNKVHWNTLDLTGNLPDALVRELIDHSYDLVAKTKPAKNPE